MTGIALTVGLPDYGSYLGSTAWRGLLDLASAVERAGLLVAPLRPAALLAETAATLGPRASTATRGRPGTGAFHWIGGA